MITYNDIDCILQKLSQRVDCFLSECQFQHELAREIREYFILQGISNQYEIELEFPSNNLPKRIYYDLVIKDKTTNEYCVIELKYKTKKEKVVYKSEKYNLTEHAAVGNARFDFLKDIERLENFGQDNKGRTFALGFAIFLTNTKSYQNKATTANYSEFSIAEPLISSGTKRWKGGMHTGRYNSTVNLKGEYMVDWKNYGNNGWYYLIIKVKK